MVKTLRSYLFWPSHMLPIGCQITVDSPGHTSEAKQWTAHVAVYADRQGWPCFSMDVSIYLSDCIDIPNAALDCLKAYNTQFSISKTALRSVVDLWEGHQLKGDAVRDEQQTMRHVSTHLPLMEMGALANQYWAWCLYAEFVWSRSGDRVTRKPKFWSPAGSVANVGATTIKHRAHTKAFSAASNYKHTCRC